MIVVKLGYKEGLDKFKLGLAIHEYGHGISKKQAKSMIDELLDGRIINIKVQNERNARILVRVAAIYNAGIVESQKDFVHA